MNDLIYLDFISILTSLQWQAPGWCYRLYPEDVYDQFAPTAIPEVFW